MIQGKMLANVTIDQYSKMEDKITKLSQQTADGMTLAEAVLAWENSGGSARLARTMVELARKVKEGR